MDERPGIDEEFCRYQQSLIKGELKNIEEKIDKLQNNYPNLR
ncbi:hypothetical protein RintRC_1071 [Richelia intracellularis]|nr:hypothetical protein RintRC_1071 [Richelia intracellularis]